MRLAIKILGIYTIVILLYSVAVNFLMIGKMIPMDFRVAMIALASMIPVIILAILAIIYSSKK